MNLQPPYTPQEVTDVFLAFPGHVEPLMPAYEDIPDEFKRWDDPWQKIAATWFYDGLSPDVKFHCLPGIDGATAYRHLAAVLGSFQPKHEHKLAAVAYLMSLWFEKIEDWQPSATQTRA